MEEEQKQSKELLSAVSGTVEECGIEPETSAYLRVRTGLRSGLDSYWAPYDNNCLPRTMCSVHGCTSSMVCQ